jgi:hypothetical protein
MAINVSELNTGKLSFEGVKIKGALGGSGDGLSADTIELVPDVDLYDTHQYLIIDPTTSDHIHIRAGGPQDDSDATLILGAEKSNISIDDQADAHISILSRTEDGTTSHVWQFNNDGSTRFPLINADLHNESAPQLAEVLQFNSLDYQSVITNAAPLINVNAKRIVLQGQRGTGTGAGGDVYLWGGDAQFDGGNIQVYAGDADNEGSGEGGYVNIKAGRGRISGGAVSVDGGVSTLGIGGDVAITGGTGATHGEVTIASNSFNWTFSNAGTTTFPTITTNLLGVSTSAEGLKFGDNTKRSVITGPTPAASTAVKEIIVQGQDQTGAAGGDVCLYGGKSNRNAGDINITAGTSTGASYTGGTVTLQAGSNSAGTAGNVSILGGTGSSTVNDGEVTITSGSNEWIFNNDGNITIPTSKDIREPGGSTAISGGNRIKACLPTVGAPAIVVDTSNIYLVDTRNFASTIILPDSKEIPTGYEFTVTDTYGSAASKNITITAVSGDLIISAPSGIAIDTNYGLITFKNVGSGWLILYGR